jgi:purine-binding chemotaxis protein CheW
MVQLLLFSVEDIHGAIPLADTSHVIRMVRLDRVPGAPFGENLTMNFHGRMVPVISVRALFGLPRAAPRLTDMLVITRDGDRDAALWVDEMSGIQDYPITVESKNPPGQSGWDMPGVCVTPEGLRVITDLPRLIASRAGTLAAPVIAGEPDGTVTPGSEDTGDRGEPPDWHSVASILAERAHATAQPDAGLSETAVVEVLKFRLAYHEYAIGMQHIREVILTGEITPVPGTPDYISGICVVRGEIISLVDLRVLLSIPERGLTDLNRVIVLTDHTLTFGILADQITGIGSIGRDRIAPAGTAELPGKNDYVEGIADGTVTVLDTAKLFADPRMIIEDG